MTVPFAHRARFALETLEGREMMSAVPMFEPYLELTLTNAFVSSEQPALTKVGTGTLILPNTNDAGSHALYQDIFIPANQSSAGAGAGERIVSIDSRPAADLDTMTDLAGVEVDDGVEAPVKAGYDFKANKKV